MQQQLINAQLGNYNNYMSTVNGMEQQGAFNPAQRLNMLNQQSNYDMRNAMSSEAGAARALGYRPGDTAPIQEMNQTRGNFQLQNQQEANQILNQSYANHLAALQGAPNPSGNGAIQSTGQAYEADIAKQQDLGSTLKALAPYLQGALDKKSSASSNTGSAPANPSQKLDYGYFPPYGISPVDPTWSPLKGWQQPTMATVSTSLSGNAQTAQTQPQFKLADNQPPANNASSNSFGGYSSKPRYQSGFNV